MLLVVLYVLRSCMYMNKIIDVKVDDSGLP